MDVNNNINSNMELPLETQLAIIRLAKKHYVHLTNNNKEKVKHNKSRFFITDKYDIDYKGLCWCIQSALKPNYGNVRYIDLYKYIPIFNDLIIYDKALELGIRIKKPNTSDSRWYPVEEYKNRIDVLNFMIKYLKLKIKENGENLCNA